MIDNQLTTLYGYIVRSDHPPTAGAYQRFDDLKPELVSLRAELQEVVASDVAAFNELVAGLDLPPVIVGRVSDDGGSLARPGCGGIRYTAYGSTRSGVLYRSRA